MRAYFIGPALLGISVAACSQAEPRSQQYFEANIEEAREIVAGCTDGSVRGGECENADLAVRRADAKARTKKFLGDGKAYTPH